jgi:hypothetical protein
VKDPIDAVPDPELLFKGFEVDVAGPQFNRPGNDEVHQSDDSPSEPYPAGQHFLLSP